MDHDPDRLTLWPSYFDVRRSRRSGRRVAKDAAVKKPDLEGLYTAARAVGLRKIKREANAARPSDPHAREGRLIVSRPGAEADAGASSKEEIMQIIGTTWREQRKKEHEAATKPATTRTQGGSRPAKQGKSRGNTSRRRSFKR